jgi:tRNA 2-thiouridine synthesizing protein E
MIFEINGKTIETDAQGFLRNMDDWNEEFAAELAKRDGIELFVDHWELIMYFREYYSENLTNPSMHTIVRTLGKMKGDHFHNQKEYERHIYKLFPVDPIHEICKLAGLPMPPPDT